MANERRDDRERDEVREWPYDSAPYDRAYDKGYERPRDWSGERNERWAQRGGDGYGAARRDEDARNRDYGRMGSRDDLGDYAARGYGPGRRGRDDGQYGGYRGGPYQEDEGGYASDRGGRDYADDRSSRRERGFIEKASDEVASWFGDTDAERRRNRDAVHQGRGPKGYLRSAERIKEDVSDRLTDNPYVDASEIEVQVEGTEVTLTGTVSDRSQRRRAEACAEQVSGVTHVQNNLRILMSQQGYNPLGTGTGLIKG